MEVLGVQVLDGEGGEESSPSVRGLPLSRAPAACLQEPCVWLVCGGFRRERRVDRTPQARRCVFCFLPRGPRSRPAAWVTRAPAPRCGMAGAEHLAPHWHLREPSWACCCGPQGNKGVSRRRGHRRGEVAERAALAPSTPSSGNAALCLRHVWGGQPTCQVCRPRCGSSCSPGEARRGWSGQEPACSILMRQGVAPQMPRQRAQGRGWFGGPCARPQGGEDSGGHWAGGGRASHQPPADSLRPW